MNILYQDAALMVVIKPPALSSECTPNHDGLADLLAAQNGGYIGVVHRLDRGVGGVMLYAKTQTAAAALSRQVQERTMKKEYLAILHGTPIDRSGTLCDLLFHDRFKNKTFVVERARQGVKEAILSYTVEQELAESPYGALSLVSVSLLTGRTHQIRVQFSSRGHSLLGDGKYGAHDRCDIGLFCRSLTFVHPVTKQTMQFSHAPSGEAWMLFEK